MLDRQMKGRTDGQTIGLKCLTILGLKVSEAELRAFACDQKFSIQGENHGLVLHVDHTPDHVPFLPWMSKVAAASVHPSALHDPTDTGIRK